MSSQDRRSLNARLDRDRVREVYRFDQRRLMTGEFHLRYVFQKDIPGFFEKLGAGASG